MKHKTDRPANVKLVNKIKRRNYGLLSYMWLWKSNRIHDFILIDIKGIRKFRFTKINWKKEIFFKNNISKFLFLIKFSSFVS